MMRTCIAGLALAGVSGWAAAQSSVTLYGIVDTGFSHGSGSLSHRNRLSSGGNATSRIGFRGVEDLGGGLAAAFALDAAFTSDDGQGQASSSNNQANGSAGAGGLTFNRRSTLSLLGSWGELRLGRDLAAHYLNKLEVDPFHNIGVGAAQPLAGSIAGPTGVRVSNMVAYSFPHAKAGPYGTVQYFMGENASTEGLAAHAGTGAGARIGYAAGPVDLALGYGRTAFARSATTGDIRTWNAAATYAAAAGVELGAGYYVDRVGADTPVTARGWILSATVTRGSDEFKAAASRYGTDAGAHPSTTKFALGQVHWLSKRTALYATYARVHNQGGAKAALNQSTTAANQASSGFDVGVRHAF
jgi:predicted porin